MGRGSAQRTRSPSECDVLALSEAATTGVFALAGIVFTVAGGIIVAAIARDTRRQSESAKQTVDEFETAWQQRGKLLDGLEADLDWTSRRLGIVEAREKECRERLTRIEQTLEPPHV